MLAELALAYAMSGGAPANYISIVGRQIPAAEIPAAMWAERSAEVRILVPKGPVFSGEAARVLTAEEQRLFAKAHRRSIKVLYEL